MSPNRLSVRCNDSQPQSRPAMARRAAMEVVRGMAVSSEAAAPADSAAEMPVAPEWGGSGLDMMQRF